jgi:hypothetical protein
MKRIGIGIATAGLVCLSLVLAGTAIGGADSAAERPGDDRDAMQADTSHQAVSAALNQGTPAKLPPLAAAQLEGIPGVRIAESVHATQSAAGQLYLTPTADGACLSLVQPGRGAGFACSPAEPAVSFEGCVGDIGEVPVCKRAVIMGVVPAGVEAVHIVGSTGNEMAAAGVVNGAYLIAVDDADDARRVEYEAGGKTVQKDIPRAADPQ